MVARIERAGEPGESYRISQTDSDGEYATQKLIIDVDQEKAVMRIGKHQVIATYLPPRRRT